MDLKIHTELDLLKAAATAASHATARPQDMPSNPAMAGIKMRTDGDTLVLEATDRYLLVRVGVLAAGRLPDVVVDASLAKTLRGIRVKAAGASRAMAELTVEGDFLKVTTGLGDLDGITAVQGVVLVPVIPDGDPGFPSPSAVDRLLGDDLLEDRPAPLVAVKPSLLAKVAASAAAITGRADDPVRLRTPVTPEVGVAATKPVRATVTAGALTWTALVMPVRLPAEAVAR